MVRFGEQGWELFLVQGPDLVSMNWVVLFDLVMNYFCSYTVRRNHSKAVAQVALLSVAVDQIPLQLPFLGEVLFGVQAR